MCLRISNNEVQVAEEDIVCYKFLRVNSYEVLFSPYQGFKYELGVEYSTEFTVFPKEHYNFKYELDENGKIGSVKTRTVETHYDVEEGLHSFRGDNHAYHFGHLYSDNYMSEYVIVECIIPKGASYYEGTWYGRASYASNKLTVTKILQKYSGSNNSEESEDVP